MTGTLGLDRPDALWLLVLVVPLVWGAVRTRRKLPVWRRALALALRIALLLVLVLALGEVTWRRPVDDLAVVFVLDRSASIGPDGEARALGFVQAALAERGPHDQAGVVVFGAEALVEVDPREDLVVHGVESAPSPHQSDLAAGLRLGTALLPADRTRRLVLLTDGEQTRGDASAQALSTAGEDLEIAVVPLGEARGPDVRVEDLVAPARVDQDAPFEVKVVARADTPTTATLRLYRNESPLGELPIALDGARSKVFTFRQPGAEPGLVRYRVTLEADATADALPQNNHGLATVQVSGEPRVLLAEREPGQGRYLAAVLAREGLSVDVVPPEQIPAGLAGLRPYAAVLLSDVPSYAVSTRQQEALRAYVRDLGRGLAMLGGEQSFGVGGWYDSPVEEALPVRMDIEDKTRFPKLAMVLAIDKSCSMGGGAGSKLDLAREAALQTAELLSDRDLLGVIGFDGAASWIAPMRELTDRQGIIDDLGSLRPGGGTDVYPALNTAIEALDGSDAALKHIILLSDGMTSAGDYETLITGARQRQVTLTAIGIGTDTDQATMADFARWGGGSYYLVTDPSAIPAIFTRETMLASRSFLVEEPFRPTSGAPSDLTRGIDVAQIPTLLGHVATDPRERATVALWVPHDEAPTPLLASWRYGLGRSVAFTSDAKARWAKDWVGTPSYTQLWTQVARWLVAEDAGPDVAVDTEIRDGALHVVVDAFDGIGGFRNFLEGTARVIAPDLVAHDLPLRQVGPGRYEAQMPVDQDGSWLVGVSLRDGDAVVGQAVSEAVQAYSPEYRAHGAGAAWIAEIGRVGRGGVITDPATVFRRPEVAREVPRPLWPPLIALAAFLLLADVAIRRLDLRPPPKGWVTAPAGAAPARGLPLQGSLTRAAVRAEAAEAGDEGAPPRPEAEVDPASYAGRLLAARRAARRKLNDDR